MAQPWTASPFAPTASEERPFADAIRIADIDYGTPVNDAMVLRTEVGTYTFDPTSQKSNVVRIPYSFQTTAFTVHGVPAGDVRLRVNGRVLATAIGDKFQIADMKDEARAFIGQVNGAATAANYLDLGRADVVELLFAPAMVLPDTFQMLFELPDGTTVRMLMQARGVRLLLPELATVLVVRTNSPGARGRLMVDGKYVGDVKGVISAIRFNGTHKGVTYVVGPHGSAFVAMETGAIASVDVYRYELVYKPTPELPQFTPVYHH